MELGNYIRDVFTLNKDNKNIRIFGPDEALSNRFNHVFEVENRTWNFKAIKSTDEYLAKNYPENRYFKVHISDKAVNFKEI